MAKRDYGTGHLYIKQGSYFGRWRGPDGRLVNRKVGPVRSVGARGGGLTRVQAERELRRIRDAEELAPRPAPGSVIPTVDEVTDLLRQKQRLGGARPSYLENCESMQRVHISPRIGSRPITDIRASHIEAIANAMLGDGKPRKPSATSSASSIRSSSTRSSAASCARTSAARDSPRAASPRRRQPGPSVPDRRGARGRDPSDPRRDRRPCPGADRRGRPGPRRRHRPTCSGRCCASWSSPPR